MNNYKEDEDEDNDLEKELNNFDVNKSFQRNKKEKNPFHLDIFNSSNE